MTDSVHLSELHFDYSKKSALYFVFFLLTYEISTYIANDMIMPGMIEVVRSFNAPDSMIAASLTAFIFGGGSLQLFLGPLSDRFGRRPVMIAGVILFLICNLGISFSTNMEQFILGRFFQGMGLCFISVIGYATLHEMFVETYAVRIISIMNSITILAPLSGPLAGAIIIYYFSWRMVFYLITASTAAALLGILIFMPETVGKTRRDGTINPHTSLRLSVVKNNYIALVKNTRFFLGSLAIGFLSVPIIAWIGTAPLILIKAGHLSVMEYGLWQIPVFIFGILGNMIVRRHIVTQSLERITEQGSLYILLSLLFTTLIIYVFRQHYLTVIVGITVYSFALGYVSAPLNRLTLYSSRVPKGTASALISVVLMLITGLGNQLAGLVYSGASNGYFGLYCAACGLIYYLLFLAMKRADFVSKMNEQK